MPIKNTRISNSSNPIQSDLVFQNSCDNTKYDLTIVDHVENDEEPIFENLEKEESYFGKMILNGRNWLLSQVKRVNSFY